ncbi:putative 1-alkyl-2-acetylglycerophosphocholine esterase-like protein [Cladobotryum mycophilum]|uniref:1-alkyl-2-acetylglycerophosphocholine esterase n=1 Tax=Cladobotryum mycophilum TaxID=491253 RepID=A0ABR0SLK4_9HYPO
MRLLTSIRLFSAVATAVLVPGPFGPYDVAVKIQPLTDTSRPDPFDPTGQSKSRRLLVSVFLPIEKQRRSCPPTTVPYMTPPVAASYGEQANQVVGLPATFYNQFEMQFCDLSKLPSCAKTGKQKKKYPLILFGPGLAESRLIYNAMARSLASQGYVVVSVDHPFEAPAIQFPDGSIIEGIDIDSDSESVLEKVLSVRTTDMSFIIDQLSNKTITDPLLADFPGTLDLKQLAMWGHSFGGATSASLLHSDERLVGGLDLDGMLVNPILSTDITKPFVLAGQLAHDAGDPTWGQFWPHLKGKSMQIGIDHTLHGSFKDILLLASVLDLTDETRQAIQQAVGSIDPYQLDKDLNGILNAFFKLIFNGQPAPLQNLPQNFANVSIVRRNNL